MPAFLDPLVDISPGVTGSWQTVDVSAHVPIGTTGVILKYVNATSESAKKVGARMTGSTDDRPFGMTVSGVTAQFWRACGVNASRQLDIWIDSANISVYLVGYFGGEAHFFTNAVNKSLGVTGSWQDVDISGDVQAGHAAILAFLEVIGLSANTFGLRKNGSAEAIEELCSGAKGGFVGLDANQKFECYISDAVVDIWLVGYLRAGAVVDTNETDVSGSLLNYNWKDLPALPAGAIGGLYRLHTDSSQSAGVRCNGAADAHTTKTIYSVWAAVKCDASRVVEGYQSGAAVNMFQYGYFTALSSPAITLLDPDHGSIGASITITGTDFGATQGTGTVTVNGTPVVIESWSDTEIVITIPEGVSSGDIVVTNDYGGESAGEAFVVDEPVGGAIRSMAMVPPCVRRIVSDGGIVGGPAIWT